MKDHPPETADRDEGPGVRTLWEEKKIEFSELPPRLQQIGQWVAWVAAAGSFDDPDIYRRHALRAAEVIGPDDLDELPLFFHVNPPEPPDTHFGTHRRFGVWMSACQRAAIEIAAQAGEKGRDWLHDVSLADYDWPQVDAMLRLLDLVEEGDYPVSYLIWVTSRLHRWLDSQWEPVLERLQTWKGPLPEEALEHLEAFCGDDTLYVARACRHTRPDRVRHYARKFIAGRRAYGQPVGFSFYGDELVELLEWFPEESAWIEAEISGLVERALQRETPDFLPSLLALAGARPRSVEPMVPRLIEWVQKMAPAATPGTDQRAAFESLEILWAVAPPGLDLRRLTTEARAEFISSIYRDLCDEFLGR